MNCMCSEEIRSQNLQNKRLERNLQTYKRKYNNQIKLLMLGTRNAGKSTFLRQIRKFDTSHMQKERMRYVRIIHQNIFDAMQILINAMDILDIPYESKENAAVNAALIRCKAYEYPILFQDIFLIALKDLWADAGIQECYMRGRGYEFPISTKYFFNNLDRIAHPEYIPNNGDILRAYVPSTRSIKEHSFTYKNIEFLITDVTIQGSEYKKWLHCFDNVTSIIYMVSLAEYDSRLEESLELLSAIVSYKCFENIAIILVMNKLDLFEEKIMYCHLRDYFPDYKGPDYDPLCARSFILDMFLSIIPSKRRVYYYFSCSIDERSESITFIYRAVRDIILNLNLYNFNLV